MKKGLRYVVLGLILGISVPAFVGTFSAKEVKGYSAESSLPTTIDLNDCSASDIRSYYSDLNGKTASELQGTNLLKHLKTILKNGQKYYSYDSGNTIWQIYEIADRDWSKSPASSTQYGSYKASSNTITGYTYGTSSSSSKNNPYIHALYIDREANNQTRAWDDHQQTQWGINREHVWPKAEGFETSGAGGARGDPMHLMAGNGYANNIHSNYYYGYVKQSGDYTNCGDKYSNLKGNLKGTSKTLNTGTVFEPQDSDKGDIARAIFYMVARYNYYSGSDSDGINSNNPNLVLTQNISDWSSSGYSSTTSKSGKMGVLTDLLAWHHADPVDEYEIHRNNLLYTNYTNNRNPFIDFPEWVDYIWGTATYSGTTYQSYSSTPTGSADPTSDIINGYHSQASVTISDTTLQIEKNNTATLSATSSNNSTITWTSSNTSVATVSSSSAASGASITVTGKAAGTATITAKATISGTNYTKTCTVTVSNPKTLSSIAVSGQSTAFTKGDTFEFDGTVTATFSDSTTADVTSSATFSGYNMNTTGEQTVTASYTYSGTTKTATYTITVSEAGGGGSPKDDVLFAKGFGGYTTGSYSTAGTDYTGVANSTNNSGATYAMQVFNGSTGAIRGNQSGSGNFSVRNKTTFSGYYISKITLTVSGGTIDGSTSERSVVYFGTSAYANPTTAPTGTATSASPASSGQTTLTWTNTSTSKNYFILYNLKTASVALSESASTALTVTWTPTSSAATLSSISLDTTNVQTSFGLDEEFNYDNLVVTAHYSDNSTATIADGDYAITTPDTSTEGEKTVTVTYNGKTAHYTINVEYIPVNVDGVSLNTNSKSIALGDTYQLVATVSPSDATNKDVSWSSDDTNIAEVTSGGLVTAKAVGSCTITVTTDDGEFTDECDITVTNPVSGEEKTVSMSIESYADANNWTNGTQYSSMNIDSKMTATIAYTPYLGYENSGKYYSNNQSWRIYQNESAQITISAGTGCTIKTITFVFVVANTGTLLNPSSAVVTSGTAETINATSATFSIGNSGSVTNGNIQIQSISVTYIDSSSEPLTSITASALKTFKVGETITSSDLAVVGNNGTNITSFSFANNNYQFKYEDAASGGGKTNKTFTNAISATVSGTTYTCSLTVKVIREAYARPINSTTYTGAQFASAGVATSYTENQTKTVNGMSFAINGYVYNNKLSLSETKTEASGSIKNKTAYSAGIYAVDIYGATPDIQVSTNGSTWVDLDNADVEGTNYYYFKAFYKNTATSSYVNISSIVVKTKTQHTPTVVANYIMFEDTEGQCEEKLDIALAKLNDMSNADKSTFMSSNDYVIKTARERIQAWAVNQGKTLALTNNTFVLNNSKILPVSILSEENNSTALIAIISVMAIGVIGGYFFLRKRKEINE